MGIGWLDLNSSIMGITEIENKKNIASYVHRDHCGIDINKKIPLNEWDFFNKRKFNCFDMSVYEKDFLISKYNIYNLNIITAQKFLMLRKKLYSRLLLLML